MSLGMRWLCAPLLVLVLALGLAAPEAGAADMNCQPALDAAGAITVADGCNNAGGLPASACVAPCASACAILPIPSPAKAAVSSHHAPAVAVTIAGRHVRPDPYPPRPAVLI